MFRQMLVWRQPPWQQVRSGARCSRSFGKDAFGSRWSARPTLIALAATMLDRHGDRAEQMAFSEEDRAWRYSDTFEQGKWRRVRKRVEAMQDHRNRLCRSAYDDTSTLREKKFDNSINPL